MSASSTTTEAVSRNFTNTGTDRSDLLGEEKKHENEIDSKKRQLFQQVFGIDFSKLELKMPKSLSPSAALEFQSCPQSYLLQYLLGLKQPTTDVLAKGSLIHKALEKIYDLPPSDRSLDTLQNVFRQEWSDKRLSEEYQHLFRKRKRSKPRTIHKNLTKEDFMLITQEGEELVFDEAEGEEEEVEDNERDIDAERTWGEESLKLLENYVEMEDPTQVKNILRREVWVMSKLNVTSSDGQDGEESASLPSFLVRGIVDRLDLVFVSDEDPLEQMMFMDSNNVSPKGDGQDGQGINYFAASSGNTKYNGGVLRITDYKTGKAPTFQYSREVNERIANEKFWQLKVYALLLQKMMSENKGRLPKNYPVRYLRLLYLTSDTGQAQYLEMDLGSSEEERLWELYQIKQELIDIWISIQRLVETQDIKEFQHCNRSFCWCHKVRPYCPQGILWERTPTSN